MPRQSRANPNLLPHPRQMRCRSLREVFPRNEVEGREESVVSVAWASFASLKLLEQSWRVLVWCTYVGGFAFLQDAAGITLATCGSLAIVLSLWLVARAKGFFRGLAVVQLPLDVVMVVSHAHGSCSSRGPLNENTRRLCCACASRL
jgi:hypothetical protein